MKQYNVRSGQNIYDVALAIYGTVEGLFDLLASNDWLSMETVLSYGMTLNYHEDFIVNPQIANWLKENGVLVKNGEHVYDYQDIYSAVQNHIKDKHKEMYDSLENMSPDEKSMFWEDRTQPCMIIQQQGQLSAITASLKEGTHLFIDWGDCTALQIVEGTEIQETEHCYKSSGIHQITMYGDAEFKLLDLTYINGIHYPLREIRADEFKSRHNIKDLNKLIITQ